MRSRIDTPPASIGPTYAAGDHLLGKLAYGIATGLVLPALLYCWALGTAPEIRLTSLQSRPLGAALMALGVTLMLSGFWALRFLGGGLPMNPFPPPRFVRGGVYALVPHPIYVGFCSVVLGLSVHSGSASGLWLVTPFTIAGCAALVLGYERHDLIRRFGVSHPESWLHLASDEDTAPTFAERVSVNVFVLLPWLFVYQAIIRLGLPPDARSLLLPGEARWPTLPGAELPYLGTFAAVAMATMVAPSRTILRRFALRGLMAMALAFPLYLTFALIAPGRASQPWPWLAGAFALVGRLDGATCALPSFHAIWTVLSAIVLASAWPGARLVVAAWAGLALASGVLTGRNALLGVLGGLLAAAAVVRAGSIWAWLRRSAERIANSWQEWHVGPVRVINHGIYPAVGMTVGAVVLGCLAGPRATAGLVLSTLCCLLFAALWGQVIEGSSQLLRPYGFYGGVLGVIIGSLLSPLVGTPTWLILAGGAAAGPYIQAFGRLRCLVQGCCHGRPAPPEVGIRYTHPRSRVTTIAHLDGIPLHPTPLYSILWNVLIAMVMGRLWFLHAPLHFIGGLYLVLTGLGRFVEESYRGEPQTKILGGLRLYQWIAIGTVIAGGAVTVLGHAGDAPTPEFSWPPMVAALATGLVTFAALGVDFPSSNRRFSRLV